ncbi:probable ATP-dependent RNA helicase DDX60 [Bombina bombina]|uniref:probable ATP-dependent RNA helicase DDX60 n=1 Tax=Bombina bombina TaxID=8345 RepID=UPI00235AC125|nr:probable ATP-dependent RNA helicase DDX60 [Bombina bombina]
MTSQLQFVQNFEKDSCYVSLLNDYVESEFFLIDGDSLMLNCATDTSLKPRQNLHFFFLIERFLLNLKNKGAKFSVVFFEEIEYFYHKRPDLMSLRTQLKLHLEKNTDTDIYTFSNFLSPSWNMFLSDNYPYFLMVSDEGINVSQTYFLNLLMLNALGNKINVVLIAGQEVDNLRVYGFHIKCGRHQRLYMEKKTAQIEEVSKLLISFAKTSHEVSLQKFSPHLCLKSMNTKIAESIDLLTTLWHEESDIRLISCVVSCAVAMELYGDISKLHQETSDEQNPGSSSQEDITFLTLDEAADLCKMYCLSIAFLLVLPLSQRANCRNIKATWNRHAFSFLVLKASCENITLKTLEKLSNWKITWTTITDIHDNLLLKNIAYYYEKDCCTELELKLGNEIEQKYKYLWNTVLQLVPQHMGLLSTDHRTTSTPFLSKESTVDAKNTEIPSAGLIPIESEVVEEYAGDIIKELPFLSRNDPVVTSLTERKTYDELHHWHSERPLSDDYDRTKDNFTGGKKDKYELKSYQKQQTFQRFYGQYLGVKTSKKITVQKYQPEKKFTIEKNLVKKKELQKTKKDKIIEENQKRINIKEENKESEQWKSMGPSLEKAIRENFEAGIKSMEGLIKTFQKRSVKFLAEVSALKTSSDVWLEHCKTQSSVEEERNINIAVEIMKRIQIILNKYNDMLQKEDLQRIAKYLSTLGFENLASLLKSTKVTGTEVAKMEGEYSVGVDAARFQMTYMGHFLLRDERTDPDPRVQHFIPDTWQRELLDVVDNNESAVIVAPTSSGKTYASYYCMEKVLSQSDDGIVVYVAPTKALVNQVVTTVTNQFNKDLPDGMAVCGVFTRDYRTDALNSQVLVTVPQCLEILLLSPHRQQWAKRIKYIIFDEIHCLGGEIGAEVWEHLLVMIRCPFLALSATISNPEHLTAWLQSVKQYWQNRDEIIESTNSFECTKKRGKRQTLNKEKKSYRVHLVLYEKRYNDLEKYVCSLENSSINFEHYHPCAALTLEHMEKYGIPRDLDFSPRESIQLYDTMVTTWADWPNKEELDPEQYLHFKDKIAITKNDAKQYEDDLKKELINWIKNGNKEKVSKVLISVRPAEPHDDQDSCLSQFPLFVEKLREEDKLPALFFAFNIGLVEDLTINLRTFLLRKQKMKQKKMTEKQVQKLTIQEKKLEKSLKKGPRHSRTVDSLVTEAANYNAIRKKLQKNCEIPPDCTYADKRAANEETLRDIFFATRRGRYAAILRALALRGIGFHHGSVDAKGRQLVEILFRMGYIRVITATGTLALGINMPCKSVVFVDDSVYLDALNYRQMSGRAGRRGEDVKGNVFFFNIPLPKVKKLLKSNVPQLKGQFPLSITLVLRLMLLAEKADYIMDARAKALSVLKHSLMSFKQPLEIHMLKLYFLFSLHFLIHEGYLDQKCSPMGFTGLVTHLHYHEPANFVFVSFLEKGLFHQLCQPESKDQIHFSNSVMESLVLVLSNLFGRRYHAPSKLKSKGTFSQSKVFLDNLPDDFAAVLKEYNKKISRIFGNCLLTVSKLADMEQECILPLSKISFSGEKLTDSELTNHLMSCTEGRSAISPFACLSGNTDQDLFNVAIVNSLLLQTAYINERNIPKMYLRKVDACGRTMLLNSYVLDFFKHGSLHAIVKENGFNEGDAFVLLKDFKLAVAAISVSLKEMCEDENDRVVLAFEQLHEMFKEKLDAVARVK